MSLPHSKIKTKGYPITIKSNPDKSEIQTRIELLKKNGYKIDESKVKSWGPNLQKMWSKISSKYITLDGRPYTAPVNNNDVTYIRYTFIPFDKYRDPKREKTRSDFVRLLNQLNYIQTPFTNTTLVDYRGKKYDVTDSGGSRFVTFPGDENNLTDIYQFRTVPRDQAYREEYEEKNKNPFFNDLSDRNDFPDYDFNDYSKTPTQSSKTESIKSTNNKQPEQKDSQSQRVQKAKSFTDTFNDARKNKLQFFTYNGKLYHSMTNQELNGDNSEWLNFKNNSKELGQFIDSKSKYKKQQNQEPQNEEQIPLQQDISFTDENKSFADDENGKYYLDYINRSLPKDKNGEWIQIKQ